MVHPKRSRSLTPEEKRARSIRAKRRFRALVRLAAANRAWLEDDDEQLGDNIQKNIRILTRKKEQKSLLSLAEKALLNKPKELRTQEEQTLLMRCIGRLKCFRKYPNEVKDRLPGVMFYLYLGPNRVLLKQGHDPVNAYVLLSGEVRVTQTYYDRLLKETCTREFPGMPEGSLVGEVALLTGYKRTASITTATPCEFLYLSKEDFDVVLKQTVSKRWAEVQANMASFTYFKTWNEIDIRESCIMSRSEHFKMDDVVLSQTQGLQDFVHFITKGRCYVLEAIFVKEFYKDGLKSYELLEGDKIPKEMLLKTRRSVNLAALRRLALGRKNVNLSVGKSPSDTQSSRKTSRSMSKAPESVGGERRQTAISFSNIFEIFEDSKQDEDLDDSLSGSSEETMHNIKLHFIKICTFHKLSCFNLGENRQNRLILAEVDTECFLLPRYLLFEKSRTIFQRIKEFLDKRVPDSQQIFQNHLMDLKWKRYKHKIKADLLATKSKATTNSVHNVPYSIRLENDLEFNMHMNINF